VSVVRHQVQLKKLPVLNAKGITIYANNAGPLMNGVIFVSPMVVFWINQY
jgi:hypothetical protein